MYHWIRIHYVHRRTDHLTLGIGDPYPRIWIREVGSTLTFNRRFENSYSKDNNNTNNDDNNDNNNDNNINNLKKNNNKNHIIHYNIAELELRTPWT